MKLRHTSNASHCTTTTTLVGRPVAIVNYLNEHLSSVSYSSLETTSLNNSAKLLSRLVLYDDSVITIEGYPKDVLPMLSWLRDAKNIYCEYLLSNDEDL